MAFIRTICWLSLFILPATATADYFIGLGDQGLEAGIGQPSAVPAGTNSPNGGDNVGLTVGVGSGTSVFALGTLTPPATTEPAGDISASPNDGTMLDAPRSTESVVVEW